MPAVSTLTFYDIEDDESLRDIAASIEDRFWEIVRLNPWLSGNLRVSTNGLPLLVYDEKNYKCEGMFQLFAPGEIDLSRNTSYKHYNVCLKNAKAEVPIVYFTRDKERKTNDVFFKASVIPDADSPDKSFILCVSLNHAVGDGHTYYRLLNMLSSTSEPVALNPKRSARSIVKIEKKLQNEDLLKSKAFVRTVVWGLFRKNVFRENISSMSLKIFLIDQAYIEEQKKIVKEAGKVPFVSSNDIILSWFLKQSKCTMGAQVFNMRNRVEGLTDDNVGNFEHMVAYQREDFATPELIRKSIGPTKRAAEPATPYPKFKWNGLLGIATNWSTFSREDILLNGCQQRLHLPLYTSLATPQGKIPPTFFGICIFRAYEDQLGCLMFGNAKAFARFQREDNPIMGENLHEWEW